MPDQFFTPRSVARRLVSFFRSETQSCIADFSAGDGELLRAAMEKWPNARYVATDVDDSCVATLRCNHPAWSVGKCDFLNQRSRRASRLLRDMVGTTSLVLLNPPFSCRGNQVERVDTQFDTIRCSVSMAFVLNSIPYLSPTGRLVAVLPASSRTSQKDRAAWNHIQESFSVRTVAEFGLRTFRGCAARTLIVRLQRAPSNHVSQDNGLCAKEALAIQAKIVRGTVPMHAARNGLAGPGFSFVHTTDLKGEKISDPQRSIRQCRRFTVGPSVLMPRVGRPSPDKCVLYLRRRRIVLSDCVYAIRCTTTSDAELLHRTLLSQWDNVAQRYSGTCAPYLTVVSLRDVLVQLGVEITGIEAVLGSDSKYPTTGLGKRRDKTAG